MATSVVAAWSSFQEKGCDLVGAVVNRVVGELDLAPDCYAGVLAERQIPVLGVMPELEYLARTFVDLEQGRNPGTFISQVNDLSAATVSSQDFVEDSYAGVKQALDDMGWSSHAARYLVLITDAAFLHKSKVQQALAVMDASNGEIWAKLDAGTEPYFNLINRPNSLFQEVLNNIEAAAKVRPIVIQSLWMKVRGEAPSVEELEAFADRLSDVVSVQGRIKLVQVYTIARDTAELWVSPLDTEELERIAKLVRSRTGLEVAVFSP